MLTGELVRSILPGRPLNSNKGTFGRVMLFCGSPPYPGSAFLGGSAASRIGAGLGTLGGGGAKVSKFAPFFFLKKLFFLALKGAGRILKGHMTLYIPAGG